MIKNNIQHRVILNDGDKPELPKEIQIGKKVFTIGGKSDKENLIPDKVPTGVFYGGSIGQYKAHDQNGNKYEMYIYFYRKIEGQWCAVVDAMEGDKL